MPDIKSLLNKFSTNLTDAIKNAQKMAIEFSHPQIKTEHIFYALLTQKGSLSAEILLGAKIDPQMARDFIFEKNSSGNGKKNIRLSENVKNAIVKAAKTAYVYQHKYIGTEHLLFGLLETGDENLKNLLQKKSIDIKNLKTQVINMLDNTSRFPDLREIFGMLASKEKVKEKTAQKDNQQNSALNFFGTNLTDEKIQNTVDPVIGRDEEIQRIIQILCRRSKNNPILLGEAGVGKTAIVEGLAKKIIQGEVPEILRDKKIYNLDMSMIVSGAMFRGEFEARLKQVLEEAKRDPDVIIFIDEIHTIIGAGGGGAQDAANILKPALARGDIRCIGATTFSEYRKSIENDPALERRFQPIKVNEPTEKLAIEILAGIKKNYELYHNVEITDEAVKAAVSLSKRYLPNKFLPDKAIDLLDEASAKIKIQQKIPSELLEIKKLSKKLIDVQNEKEEKVISEEFESALHLKELENALLIELCELKNKSKELKRVICGVITKEDIAKIISQITQIPIENLTDAEKTKLLDLEKILNKQVVGQEEVIKTVAQAIRRSRTGIKNQNRPVGSFMFLGPSGVGKTELAKVISENLFGRDGLVRIDMSEFAESFNISKLIGAPAGYIGYQEGGKLSETIKHKPYSVVLLDEIEKAHPDVLNLLLQILDEGHLTDASGKKINFKNSIIIMTSNVGLDSFNKQANIGFNSKKDSPSPQYDELKKHIKNELKNSFKTEFLNRLDNILIFNPLTLKNLQEIAKIKISELNKRLEEKNIQIKLTPASTKFLAEKNFSANGGAREIERNISEIENMLAESLLQNKFGENDVVGVDVKNGKLVLKNK
ncbi:MAG: ATP-dependent Clp protease ATP-binding subunit [bacterium]